MAEEEEKQEEEKDEAAEAAPKKSSKKLLLIIGGIMFLLIAIGTPVLIFTLSGEEEGKADSAPADAASVPGEVLTLEGFLDEDEAEEEEAPLGAFFPMETFVTNLSSGGYLRCQVQLEFIDRDIPKRFFAKLVPVRDSVLNLLANRSRVDLQDEKGRATLKRDIRQIINETLRREEVKEVYFTQFVIQ